MKKQIFVILAVLMVTALVLAACGETPRPTPPATYASKTNPLAGKADAKTAGAEIYSAKCANCHGEKGMGEGDAGKNLKPPAGKLAEAVKTVSDGYLYWRTAEGGMMAPWNSQMLPYKDKMKEEEIWQVITYIQGWK